MQNIVACRYIQSVPLCWKGGKIQMAGGERMWQSELLTDWRSFLRGENLPKAYKLVLNSFWVNVAATELL